MSSSSSTVTAVTGPAATVVASDGVRGSYEKILRGITALAGKRWGSVTRETLQDWIEYIADRTEEAWTRFNWPELIVVEPRVVQYWSWEGTLLIHAQSEALVNGNGISHTPGAVANMLIAHGTKVYYDGNCTEAAFDDIAAGWYSIVGHPTGADSLLSDVLAAPESYLSALTTTPDHKILRYTQDWKFAPLTYDSYYLAQWRKITQVMGIYKDDPRKVQRPRPVAYERSSEDGLILDPNAPSLVWVRHKIRPDQFYGSIYDSAVIAGSGYSANERVYLESAGEFYLSKVGSNTQAPSSVANKWLQVPYPAQLARYAKFAAFADHLRSEGEFERAELMERKANTYLEEDFHEVSRQVWPAGRVLGVQRRR